MRKTLLPLLFGILVAVSTLTLSTRNASEFNPTWLTDTTSLSGSPDTNLDSKDYRAGMRAPAATVTRAQIELPGKQWRLFLFSNKFSNANLSADTKPRLDITFEQHPLTDFSFKKNHHKQSRFFLTNADSLTLVLDNRQQTETTSAELRLKYLSLTELLALVGAALFSALLTFILLRHYPGSYLSWLLPVLTIIIYIGQTGNGMGEYAITLLVLCTLHIIWLNHRIPVINWLALPAFLAVYPLTLLTAGRYAFYGRWQDSELIGIIQSNLDESIEYINDFIGWHNILLFLLFTSLCYWLLNRHYRNRQNAGYLNSATAICLLLTLLGGFDISPQNYLLAHELNQVNAAYQQEIERWQKTKEERELRQQTMEIHKTFADEITVFVIGESLSRHHMGLYGYQRNTNPLLQQQPNLIVLSNAISNHTQTLQSIFHMITDSDNQQPKSFNEVTSLINIANAAQVHTAWLSNQTRLGFTNNWTSILASEADDNFFINGHSTGTGRNRSKSYDELLFPPFEEQLQQSSNQLIFLHLFGNHSTYAKRYPFGYTHFDEEESIHIGNHTVAADDMLNSYDNAVRYNDFIINSFIDQLKALDCSCLLVYSSDHGEDLVNRTGHNARLYTPLMVEIPVLFWYSDKWGERHADKLQNLQENRNKAFMNDSLFHTALGLMGISTRIYQAQHDISSNQFVEIPRVTLHGTQPYDKP